MGARWPGSKPTSQSGSATPTTAPASRARPGIAWGQALVILHDLGHSDVDFVQAKLAVLSVGVHAWLLTQIVRWAALPRRESVPWVELLLFWFPGCGLGVLRAVAAATALPSFVDSPPSALILAVISLMISLYLAFDWRGQLLHLRAFVATRSLLSTLRRTAISIGPEGMELAEAVRSGDWILLHPPPEIPEELWHERWSANDLLDKVPRDRLSIGDLRRLECRVDRYGDAVGRFDGYRR